MEGFWICVDRKRYALTTPLLAWQLAKLLKGYEVISASEMPDALKKLKLKVKTENVRLDSYHLQHKVYEAVRKVFSEVELTNEIANLRLVKNKKEIGFIRRACEVTSEVMRRIGNEISPGRTEIELASKIKEELMKLGVEPAYEPIVASGKNTSFPHHIPSKRKIEKDDIVLIDLGAQYMKYKSDMTRVFFVGNPDKRLVDLYNLVRNVQRTLIKEIKPGTKANFIHKLAVEIVEKSGYKRNYLHSTGHSLGLEIHEFFRISERNDAELKAGMTFTVEPGIYIRGFGGARFEDTVLVTQTGCEVLTK